MNGEPLGARIYSKYIDDQYQQPYSVEFSPKESGVYTILAIAHDNSGNYVMSDSVSLTTTTGEGSSPRVRLTRPTMVAEGLITNDYLGSIKSFELVNSGFGYVEVSKINIFGDGYGETLDMLKLNCLLIILATAN